MRWTLDTPVNTAWERSELYLYLEIIFQYRNALELSFLEKWRVGTSLVVQSLRIRLLMPGTWVRFPSQGRFHVPWCNQTHKPQILKPAGSEAHALQKQKPPQWEAHESRACSSQLWEEAFSQPWRPSAASNKQTNKNFEKWRILNFWRKKWHHLAVSKLCTVEC